MPRKILGILWGIAKMVKMLVFGRGHVVVGDWTRAEDEFLGPVLRATNAATVRRWETERGLGELADGPKKAVLDGIVHGLEVPVTAIHGVWPLTPVGVEKWSKAIGAASLAVLR
jgi:hypothetical protein